MLVVFLFITQVEMYSYLIASPMLVHHCSCSESLQIRCNHINFVQQVNITESVESADGKIITVAFGKTVDKVGIVDHGHQGSRATLQCTCGVNKERSKLDKLKVMHKLNTL